VGTISIQALVGASHGWHVPALTAVHDWLGGPVGAKRNAEGAGGLLGAFLERSLAHSPAGKAAATSLLSPQAEERRVPYLDCENARIFYDGIGEGSAILTTHGVTETAELLSFLGSIS
jgi:hypothetical protein